MLAFSNQICISLHNFPKSPLAFHNLLSKMVSKCCSYGLRKQVDGKYVKGDREHNTLFPVISL